MTRTRDWIFLNLHFHGTHETKEKSALKSHASTDPACDALKRAFNTVFARKGTVIDCAM